MTYSCDNCGWWGDDKLAYAKAKVHSSRSIYAITLTDLNDESPTDITFINNLNIAENTAANTNSGTLSTIDADAGDTFTYTLVNNTAAYFAIDGNTLKLAKTVHRCYQQLWLQSLWLQKQVLHH
jgi:hypothetical protein